MPAAMYSCLLPLWLLCEAVFAVMYLQRKAQLSKVPENQWPVDHDGAAVFDAFIKSVQHAHEVMSLPDLIVTWCKGAPIEQIKRENVAEGLCNGFWYRTRWVMQHWQFATPSVIPLLTTSCHQKS